MSTAVRHSLRFILYAMVGGASSSPWLTCSEGNSADAMVTGTTWKSSLEQDLVVIRPRTSVEAPTYKTFLTRF